MDRRYALFGSPIDRSPSPAMHNAAFAALGIPATYALRPATAADVPALIAELRSGSWDGANVTTPLKTLMASHVLLTGHAARAHAVNTIVRDAGRLYGSLTDVEGVVEPLRDRGFAGGGEGLILGAGGAARAAVLALEKLGVTVHVAARDASAAMSLLDELDPRERGSAWHLGGVAELRALFPRLALVVQATPAGREGDGLQLPWERLREGCFAFEMLALPVRTSFLDRAAAVGAETIEGWRMLVAQGAVAFETWTGKQAPLRVMNDAVRAHLDTVG